MKILSTSSPDAVRMGCESGTTSSSCAFTNGRRGVRRPRVLEAGETDLSGQLEYRGTHPQHFTGHRIKIRKFIHELVVRWFLDLGCCDFTAEVFLDIGVAGEFD